MRSFVGYRVRAEARIGWRGWAATALVIGAVGGVAIGLLAGARRTETAHERFLERSAAYDVIFANGGTTPENVNGVFEFEAVAALPEVLDSVSVRYYFPDGTQPSGAPLGVGDLLPVSSPDGRFGTELNGAGVIDGRFATGTDEIAVSVLAAEQLGLRVGDQLDVTMQPAAPTTAVAEAPPPSRFTVVGVIAMQGGLPPAGGGLPPVALLAPRYAVEHPGGAEVIAVRLEGGPADAAAFQRTLVRLAGGEQVVTGSRVEMTEAVERGPAIQATALRVLAGVVAAASVLLVFQALARQRAADRAVHGQLVALGATGGDLRLLAAARTSIVASSAAVVAVVVAVAVSPLGPVGTARHVDPGRLEVNIAYVGGGALAMVAGMVVATVLAGPLRRRRADAPASTQTPSRLAGAVGRSPLPVPVGLGARMAVTAGGGARAASNRTTFVTGVVGLVAVVTVLSFGTSLQQLFDEPRLYGWGWDVQIGDAFAPDLTSEADRLEGQSGVEAVAVATTGRIQIDGREVVDALAIRILQGSIAPVVVEGREPTDATDLLLGSRTLRDLGLEVGDDVDVGLGDLVVPMKVVGRGVLPEGGFAAGLGRGAALTLDGYRRLDPAAEADAVLLQFTDDDDGRARRATVLGAPFGDVYEPEQPSDLADLEGLGGIPALIGGVIALAALGTLAHALHTDVVHRRHDLAIFKALGFTRAQVATLVASQAAALVIAAEAVGLPLGVAAGRWTWIRFADGLGVPPSPEVPVLALVLLVPLALILAAVVTVAPAARAARTPAGEALHVD